MSAQQQELGFDPEAHAYWIGQERLPSVTQILSESGMVDTRWFTEEARLRGQAVHLACQFDDEGDLDESELDPALIGYLYAWRNFVRDYEFQPDADGIERRLYHPTYRYAGTLDRKGTALVRNLGRTKVLIDLKTGIALPAYALQLAAYANLLENPASWLRLKVELAATGKYKTLEYPVTALGRDFSIFASALAVSQWKQKEKITCQWQ